MLTVTPLPKVTPTYVQVNIGRNVAGQPMPARDWARFQGATYAALRNATIGSGVVSSHDGRGSWEDASGVVQSEESVYYSTFAVVDLDALRLALASLRDTYGQDAIALIVGSELI